MKAQQYMKAQVDKKRRPMELENGDAVLVKLQPYQQNLLALRKNQKLGLRYFGPFFIVNKISPVAYKLQLPHHARIHPIFHISLLKKFKGDPTTPYLPLPLSTSEFGPIIQPQDILSTRTLKQGHVVAQVKVHWQGMQPKDATWEDWQDLIRDFPSLNLEDKVAFHGEGIVTRGSQKEGELDNDDNKNNSEEFVMPKGHLVAD